MTQHRSSLRHPVPVLKSRYLLNRRASRCLLGVTSTDLVALATSSAGGVTGSQGLGGTSTQLAQNGVSIANSSVATGLIVTATSSRMVRLPEDFETTASSPGKVDEPVIIAETTIIDAALKSLQDGAAALVASIDNLMGRLPINGATPLNPDAATELASSGANEMAVQAAALVQGDAPGPSSETDNGVARGGWERACAIVLVTTSFVTEACVKWHGGPPLLYRGERSRRAFLSPGSGRSLCSMLRKIPRLPLTCVRSVLGHRSWSAPVRIPTSE